VGIVLNPSPSGEITNLGEALFNRVQLSRGCIVVSPKVLSSQRSPRPPLPCHGSTKSNLKDLVVANVSSSQDGTMKSATIEDKPIKSSHSTTTCSSAPRKSKSDTEQQVGGKHKQQEAQPTKNHLRVPLLELYG